MRRKRYVKRAVAGASAFIIGASGCIPAVPAQAAALNPAVGNIDVNPELRYQTLKGWGTSLCWWGNTIGSWGEQDFNGNGRPDREEIAELAFSPEYLNLNIVRYNVGGGDKEDTSIKRCEGLVPGWTEDMTGTKDGSGAFDEEAFYAKQTQDMEDAGQLWMLEQANAYRKDKGDIINEVFSNSPPYYMTKSGSSTGGNSWDLNNLKDDQYDEFAQYLARAAKWIDNDLTEKYGTGVSYIEPLNEPDTSYWQNGSTKQEGCIFNTGELQSKAYQEMQKALDAEGLTDMQITGTDETSLWGAINSFDRLEDSVKENMTTIGAHTYSGSDEERKELRHIAQSYEKDLWMSEVTKGGGAHDDGSHESMDAANTRSQSEGIMADLKYMQPTAWIAWLVADSEYECLQTNSNWGLLHAVFEKDGPVPDYHTNLVDGSGNKLDWVPSQGYWSTTKQFYTMMQYSKYLKAGYTMIDIGDTNMCAAISPDGKELVIVAQNFNNKKTTTMDLNRFPQAATAQIYRTSDTESCQLVETQDVTDKVLDVTLPQNTVTTYVIHANEDAALCDMSNYAVTVDADVVDPQTDWTSATNKFTYEGSWGESASDFGGGKYSTQENASVTFTFEGTQAIVYGTKAPEGALVNVFVDGQAATEVSLEGSKKDGNALIFDTKKLSEGTHTVQISKADGQADKLIEINNAKIITGVVLEEITEVEESQDCYTVSGVKPVLPETVTVTTNKGNTIEKPVTWKLDGMDFTADKVIAGTVEGTSIEASVGVKVVPENVQYFIDCNSPASPVYRAVNAYAGLFNEVADQAYAQGAWGYLDTYDTHEGGSGEPYDEYETGWAAKTDQKIAYTVPLIAGSYQVTFGFKEWWKDYNSSRPMKISMVKNGVSTELGTSDTWEDGNPWNSDMYEITCEAEADVTFEVAKAGSADPLLSFIHIQNQLDLKELKAALQSAAEVDRSKYPIKKLAVMDEAVKAGHPLLYQAAATQEKVTKAANDIVAAIESLGGETEIELTEAQIKANDYVLYTVNCGTPDPSVIPNTESERMGLLQSNVDQPLAADSKTGVKWGMNPATEYSKAWHSGDDATDIGNSFIYMTDDVQFNKDKSSLGYSFQVPAEAIEGIEQDTYEVTVAFKHYWDNRLVNVCLEGKTVATDVELKNGEWVSRTFTTQVKDGQLNVDVKSPRRTSTKEDPILNYIKVRAVEDTEKVIPNYTSITGTNGEIMYDTNGNQIQAHGGQIQQLTVDGETKWYWIGEDKTNDYRPCQGIHVYSSTDLYNWQDEGVVLRTMESMSEFEENPYFKDLYQDYTQEQKEDVFVDIDKNNCVMERPKMLYNEKNDNYVIWFHADGRYPGSDADYGKAKAGIAVSDSPTGPFKLLGSYKLNYVADADHGYDDARESWGSVRDMNLFKDTDGTAYVIYSSDGNKTTFISKLNEDYTWLAEDPDKAVEGVDFTRNFIDQSREAPAMFQYKAMYYIVNSGCTGWSPNPAQYAVAEHPMGPWTVMGDPCTDEGKHTTYDTQSTCVFPVDAENGKFIYMGDRWNAGDLSESRYVWLPVEFQPENKIALRKYEDWTLEELDGKGLFEIKSELPASGTFEQIVKEIPKEITVTFGTDDITTSVTWNIEDCPEDKIGTVTVTGQLTELGRSFTHDIHVISPKTQYFFDSGAKESSYFEAVKKELAEQLKNTVPDQKYSADNKAGYLGITKEEDSENFDIGLRDGENLLENGWYAAADKDIKYAFDLEPGTYTLSAGFQEWWNTQREMKISVTMEEQTLAEQNVTLPGDSRDLQQNVAFTVKKAGTVTVSIQKTGSADPVLSWICVQQESKTESADKTELKAAIDEAEALVEAEYTAQSWSDFQEVLQEAKGVYDNIQSDKAAVDAAKDALEAAQEKLVTVKSVLQDGIATHHVPEENAEKYTPESWSVYAKALAEANALLEEENLTESMVNDAISVLKTAKDNLQQKDPTDKHELEEALASLPELEEGDYTKVSWKDYAQACAYAQEMLDKADATQIEVDDALKDLRSTLEALITLESVLSAGIAEHQVPEADAEKYTQETWNIYTTALKAAQDLLAGETYTEEEAMLAIAALKEAKEGLTEKEEEDPTADKTELKAAIDEADKLVEANYTAKTWKGFQEALLEAKDVYDNAQADQAAVDAAQDELKAAQEQLVTVKSVLESKIAEHQVPEADAEKYTQETWDAYATALKAAQDLLAKESYTEEEVSQAAAALQQAKEALAEKEGEDPKADKSELTKLYEENKGKDAPKYTAESFKKFDAALKAAKSVLDNANVSQEEVDVSLEALKKAIAGLELKKDEPDKNDPDKNEPDKEEPEQTGEWKRNEHGWWLENQDGTYAANEWKRVGDEWYYFDDAGYMETGWIELPSGWYYMNQSGAMQTGWVLDGADWYYTNSQGTLQTGWVKHNGTWYYTNNSGVMQTGWAVQNDTWYYLNESGAMQTGWVLHNGTWYYTEKNGAMAAGDWKLVNGTWYYLNDSGIMQTGWINPNGTWYYLNENGAMATGWAFLGNTWYYLNNNGAMLSDSSRSINGVLYHFGNNGACLNP